MLNEKQLNMAGWLAIISAVLIVPSVILGFLEGMEEMNKIAILYLGAIFNTAGAVASVYILIIFRRLLNQKAAFYDVDKYITFMIWLTIIITALSVISAPFSEVVEVIAVATIIVIIPFGVVYAVFGIKLLNCTDNLYGYLKTLAYLHIATGIMISVVVLLPLGMLTEIWLNIIMAIILFKSAKDIQSQDIAHTRQELLT